MGHRCDLPSSGRPSSFAQWVLRCASQASKFKAVADAAKDDLRHEDTHPADRLSLSSRAYADDDLWFGLTANPEGNIHPTGADTYAG